MSSSLTESLLPGNLLRSGYKDCVLCEVLRPGGQWSNPLAGPSLFAAIITALTFRFTRSFLGATVAGMASFVVLQHALPLVVR